MKKLLLLLLLSSTVLLNAQNKTAKDWAYAARIDLDDPFYTVNVNAQGEVLLAGGGDASGYNFSVMKRDTAGGLVFRKTYVSRNKGAGTSGLDANGNLVVVSTFSDVFETPLDTFNTASVNNVDIFIAKFDSNTGDMLWITVDTHDRYKNAQVLPNGNTLIQFETFAAGDFYFAGNVITNLSAPGYVFLELSEMDGSVLRHFSFSKTQFPDKSQFILNGNLLTYLTTGSGGTFGNIRYLIKRKFDVSTQTTIQADTLFYDSQYLNMLQNLDEVPMVFHPTNNDFYLAVGERSDYTVLGADTIDAGEYAILQYDDNLNLKKRLNLNYKTTGFYMRDTTFVATMFVPAFAPLQGVFGNDTLVPFNTNETHLFAIGNLDLEHRSYAFIGTDTRGDYPIIQDVEIDGTGNVYALGFSEEDVICPPHTSQSLNRSWAHLTTLGKLSFGANSNNVGLKEVSNLSEYQTYPNPFSKAFTLLGDGNFTYELYNQQGKLLKKGAVQKEVQLNLSTAPAGLYMVKLMRGSTVSIKKVIKQ